MTPDTLLELVQRLTTQTVELAAVEKAVGGKFARTEADAYVEYAATDMGSTFGARLSLQVDPKVCATWDQARARLGFAARVPVHPGVTPTTDDWWQYPQVTSSRLSLSFDRTTGCLTQIAVPAP